MFRTLAVVLEFSSRGSILGRFDLFSLFSLFGQFVNSLPCPVYLTQGMQGACFLLAARPCLLLPATGLKLNARSSSIF